LNTIHKKVVFESLYTKEDSSCFPCFLIEQWNTNISALAASSRSVESKLLLLLDEDAEAMQVAVLCATRTAYFIYLLKLARLVTLSLFFNAFVSKANLFWHASCQICCLRFLRSPPCQSCFLRNRISRYACLLKLFSLE